MFTYLRGVYEFGCIFSVIWRVFAIFHDYCFFDGCAYCMLPIIEGESEVFTTLQCTLVTCETTLLLIIVSALHLYLYFAYLYLWVGVFLGSLGAPPLPTEKLLISGVNSLNTPPAQGIPQDRSLRT